MRRDPTYWNDVANELLRDARLRMFTPRSQGRFLELIDAVQVAARIRDDLERKHAS